MGDKRHMFVMTLALLSGTRVLATKAYTYCHGGYNAHHSFAQSHCKSRNLSLPVVQSEDDKGELAKYLHCNGITENIWMGIELPDWSLNVSDFVWADATPISWTDFGDGADKLDLEKCVIMKSNFLWYTRSCTGQKHNFICQKATTFSATSYPDIPSSAQFSPVFNHQPSGEPITVLKSSNVIRCAAHCLRHRSCDVIALVGNGDCSLYRFTPLMNQSSLPSDIRIYQKKCPPM